MSQVIADRIKELSTTTGAGAFALAGAVTGFRTFASVCSVADTLFYTIEGVNADGTLTGEWEVGFGTYSGANTLTRTTVLASSNAGAAVNFSAGTKSVWLDAAAASLVPRLVTGEVGLRTAAAADATITSAAPSSSATSLHVHKWDATAPSTDTVGFYGIKSILRTAAAAFTLGLMVHFSANAASAGAASAITTAKGFEAADAIAVGTNNYGYWTDFAAAANKFAFYGAGTAQSFLGGELGVTAQPSNSRSINIGTPTTTGVTMFGAVAALVAPSTATTQAHSYYSSLSTAAAAFTVANMAHFYAGDSTKGAGSTITNMYGFRADNAIAVGASNYGFYSNIAAATNSYQLFMGGTAQSVFAGPIGAGASTSDPTNLSGTFILVGNAGSNPGTTANVYGVRMDYIAPSTATTSANGYTVQLRSAAAAFTLGTMTLFHAAATVLGAGSTVTNVRGFHAANAIAGVGTNTYGFYSDIATATSTWQLYMGGSAPSYFGGSVGIVQNDPLGGVHALLAVGSGAVSHPDASSSIRGVSCDYVAPSTATNTTSGFQSLLRTANSSFTAANLINFFASQVVKGAASTISIVQGFYASNNIAVGANNYGFYSDINSAANTLQLFMDGTAESRFDGSVTVQGAGASQAYMLGLAGTHANTGVTLYGFQSDVTSPNTNTSNLYLYRSVGRTTNAIYTLNNMVHFFAENVVKGASNTLNNVRGFYAANAIAQAGTENAGFYSDIAANGTVNFQLKMAGTARCAFGGPVYFAQDTSAVQSTSAMFAGTGAPNNANGNNGDYYLRGDTPGTANQRLYVKSAGAWVGIV